MEDHPEFIPTRRSLLSRLKDWNDNESWKLFYDTYSQLIYGRAMKAGLTHTEAEDVLQETMFAVAKAMPNFHYDNQNGSFKSWLLNLTSWGIAHQKRKRLPATEPLTVTPDDSREISVAERLSDPATGEGDPSWDEEWRTNLLAVAWKRVREQADAKMCQMFHLMAYHGWPVERVSEAFQVSKAKVYLAKHRIGKMLQAQIKHLSSEIM